MQYKSLISGILAIALFLSGSNQLATLQYQGLDEGAWQYALHSAPLGLMEQVEAEFPPEVAINPNRMKVLHVQQPNQSIPLYIINSRLQYECPPTGCSDAANPLCGWKGTCTYFAYLQERNSYRRVLRDEFNPFFPPEVKEPFLSLSDRPIQGLPCLRFSEMRSSMSAQEISRRMFCYDGSNYISVANEIVPLSQLENAIAAQTNVAMRPLAISRTPFAQMSKP